MAEGKIRLVLLWHMHQPYYKDLATGVYRLPWVRLHALKDYYGMVAILREFPRIHQTFNLVPSLLTQVQDYAQDTAREALQEVAYQATDELDLEERLFALRFLFQANLDHLISRFPRYRDLYERLKTNQFRPEQALPYFGNRDITDLQVLSQLAWFDEYYLAEDADIRALAEKGEGYTRADQVLLRAKQQELLQKVIPEYRAAQERGQVELSTSPFYHPILPLLCDNYIAAEAHRGVALPGHRFRHPEDAQLQLQRAIELHEDLFGRRPPGLWPSEGSVSEEVMALAASLGFQWAATDQRILTNSTGVHFFRDSAGAVVNSGKLYAPYRFPASGAGIQMLFRDQEISDLIGFVYSRMDAEAAAADLVRRIVQSVGPLIQSGRDALFPIILDGENAWEHFPQNGRPFLRALYRRLSDDSRFECVTVSEALAKHGSALPLARLAPGSWIGANFDIWLGSEEDNQAWDLLWEAREFFRQQEAAAPPAQRGVALEELLVSEGSDWCWWYGPEHSTANDPDFDALYRTHLSNIYRALGYRAPERLSQPIARFRHEVIHTPQVSELAPRVDGRVSSYFEWMGAGHYQPVTRGTTMHGQPPLLRELYYGRNAHSLFLRLDFLLPVSELPDKLHFQVSLRTHADSASVLVLLSRGGPKSGFSDGTGDEAGTRPGAAPGEFSKGPLNCLLALESKGDGAGGGQPSEADRSTALGEAALDGILEARINLAALPGFAEVPFQFQVSAWLENLPLGSLPLVGWLAAPVFSEQQAEI